MSTNSKQPQNKLTTLLLASIALTVSAPASALEYAPHKNLFRHHEPTNRTTQTEPIVKNVGTARVVAEMGQQTTPWQCFLKGEPVGHVDIWWGHTKVDAAWACDNQITKCGANGGCSAFPEPKSGEARTRSGFLDPELLFKKSN
jgi:hypothetical protein